MAASTGSANQDCYLCFGGSAATGGTQDTLAFFSPPAGNNVSLITNALYRDFSAWYHVVCAVDTTQATASNRILLYVNGVQVTSFSTATYPTLNQNLNFNNTTSHTIGSATVTPANFFDGYFSEFNYIDGQQLAASSFGAFDVNGVWQPTKYAGTYGTNGFYLPFPLNTASTYSGSFNGSSQWISTPSSATFNLSTGNWTIEGWYYATGTNSNAARYMTFVPASGAVYGILPNSSTDFNLNQFGTGNVFATTNGALSLNTWQHIALVRNGSTTTLYVDGVASASSTTSWPVNSNTTLFFGGVNGTYTGYFPGKISNVRVVMGTAVYTSNFVPSTSPLTAITNTQLLTLQNSTIIDNSGNAVAITNNGSVTTAVDTPFVANITTDSSGNNNNWFSQNISLTAGATYDSMTDSPTVTSASVANYAVINPLTASNGGAVSNGNLTWTLTGTFGTKEATLTNPTLLQYAEFTIVSGLPGIGLKIAGTNQTTNPATPPASLWSYYDNGATWNIMSNGSVAYSTGTLVAAGQVWQIAYNPVTGNAWLGKNNVWYNSTGGTTGNPSAGTNPTFSGLPNNLVMCVNGGNVNGVLNANFGQQAFIYTPPTGYSSLMNTYSLPTPAIPAGAPYMNAITYTGYSNLVPSGLGQLTKRNAGSRLVSNSLRFRSSATATLTRTPSVAGNRQKWTWSGWVKLGSLSATQVLFGAGQNATTGIDFGFQSTNTFFYSINAVGTFQTTSIYRDPSAWYHVVFAFDSTQAVQANRSIVYVNGVNIPFSTNGVVQNNNYDVNNTIVQYFGQSGVSTQYLDGYIGEVNFVDGQQLTPTSFGAYNSDGIWVPISYAGTYGTNGFYLPFTQSSSFSYAALTPSGYVSAPTSTAFAVGTNAYTMEAWFYPINTSFTGGYFSIAPNGLQMGFQNSTSWGVAQANVAWELTTTSMPIVGQWNHMAIVRSGTGTNQTALFLNGTRVALGTVATSYAQNSCAVGSSNTNGYISNARLVNGTAIYSPASTTITVPTTPLTNVTNTSLLTFQNATAVDNSSNAFALTTSGTMPISGAYPFALLGTGIANDASGNGNNWTANNISTIQNTTYDTMIDSPTDYASASDYAVLNPLYNVSSEASYMSNGNLQISDNSGNSVWHQTRPTVPTVVGSKWYWEITLTTLSGGIANYTGVDLVTDNTNPPSGGAYQLYWNTANYAKTTNSGTNTNFTGTPTVNDVIQVAYDAVNGQIWFGKNGTYFEGNPSAGTGASYTGINTSSTAFVASLSTSGATSAFAINFGQQPFKYTPPTGFVGVNTYNLPTPTTSWFTTANNSVAGNTTAYPDLVWAKARSSAQNHSLTDTLRGPTLNLIANTTGAEAGLSTLFAVNKYGLTLGNDVSVNSGGVTEVVWGWQAGQNTSATNTNGSITSTVSANTTAGFSVVTYTGTGANATVGHGLGVAPAMYIVKNRGQTGDWCVYHQNMNATPQNYYMQLNLTSAAGANSTIWNNTAPTSTTFAIGSYLYGTGINYVAYCWAAVPGYSAFGSYTGNGSTDGPFVYTGFRPRWILLKNSASATAWFMFDSSRDTYNVVGQYIQAQSNTTEATQASVDFLSNGFKLRVATDPNAAASYIYAAFAENPFNSSRAR
jgi:hypothetical protein